MKAGLVFRKLKNLLQLKTRMFRNKGSFPKYDGDVM